MKLKIITKIQNSIVKNGVKLRKMYELLSLTSPQSLSLKKGEENNKSPSLFFKERDWGEVVNHKKIINT